MPSFSAALTLVASASLALAVPLNNSGSASNNATLYSFSVQQIEAGKVYKHGPSDVLRAYNKYSHLGAKAPEYIVRAASSGSVEADPEAHESSYLCPVTLGSGSTLHLDFDTGSSDLWVFSSQLPSSTSKDHRLYNPSSGGQKLQGHTWKIGYADGSGASGDVFADKVTIGGVTATRQAVEAATSVSSHFASRKNNDGLVGLAFSSINTVKPKRQLTFFDTIKDSLPQKLFACALRHKAPGSFDFGHLDHSRYKGQIQYVPVDDSQGFWAFDAGAFSVGNGHSSGKIGKAIADTGTTLMFVPQNAASAYYGQVSGARYDKSQGGYIFPCSSQLPPFNVQIGSQTISISGELINYAPHGNGMCFGGIQPSKQTLNIFGDIFLKAVYAVFDMTQDRPRLGFAPQA
ncbi:acid protease [Piedraia hortae CBS 480.64]|uniref:Acid protease n=1 Tax=Piedraia hortae CBS 480.64 TaxID=1314780 RepID=A0A6A7CD29_9PEZI|nr:acid protease [Piedraia hortae CBS 480.64]